MPNRIDALKELLGCDYPLIQGGMAWISDAALAAAVSNAGGLGVIAAGNAPPDVIEKEIDKYRELSDRPFALNIMLLSEYAGEIAVLAADKKVPVVITGAGNPEKYLGLWKENGIKIIPVVPSSALALRMERMGADAVIAEGCEAGGHIGELTTMVLVPAVVRTVSIPVIAAGGITDAASVAAAICLGAAGVQVGTRFILAEECTVHPDYQKKLIRAKDIDTRVTGRSTGHPVRLLRNQLSREMAELEYQDGGAEKIEELGQGALKRAAKDGDMKTGSIMAGQCACLLTEVEPAKAIITNLFDYNKIKDLCEILTEVTK